MSLVGSAGELIKCGFVKGNNMNNVKVNWDEVPLEYNWFAIDETGIGYVYATKPNIGRQIWNDDYVVEGYNYFQHTGEYSDWKATLQQRPTVNTTITTEFYSPSDISIQRIGDLSDIQITGKLSKQQIAKIMEIVYEER
jgi:hypothetical protein